MLRNHFRLSLLVIILSLEEGQCFNPVVYSTSRQKKTTLQVTTLKSETATTTLPIDKAELSKLDTCKSRTRASKIINNALYPEPNQEEVSNRLFNSISIPKQMSTKYISDAELALQTRTINGKYKILELIEQNGDRDIDRSSLAVLCVFIFGSSSAILAQQSADFLPDIVRWLVVFILCFSPLILTGIGLAVPEQLSSTLVAIQREIFPSYRKRMIQHEAGHFLVGYLLGWPVKTYQASNAVKNAVEFYPLGDDDAGLERASALGFDRRKSSNNIEEEVNASGRNTMSENDKPYYSKDGLGSSELERSVFRDGNDSIDTYALSGDDDSKASWPFRGFDEETLDKLAIISVAGACSEVLAYGNAEGGVADLLQLRGIYGAAAAPMNTGNKVDSLGTFTDDAKERRLRRDRDNKNGSGMDEKEMDNRTRFALGFCLGILRQNLGALDALAVAMEEDASVSDCILALEECSNVSGYTLQGDYDKIRRERFRAEQRGLGSWVERTFLGGSKTIDVEDSSVIEGKGGGDRRQGFQLQGDDVLYVAIALEKHLYNGWTEDAANFSDQKKRLVGDCAIGCAFMSYCGPFNQQFRNYMINDKFTADCESRQVPVTRDLDVISFLADVGTIGDWQIDGLPTDPLSTQNGILVTSSSRFPLLVDPQGQALQWIQNKERSNLPTFNGQNIVDVSHPKLKDKLEFCMGDGKSLIIVGVEDEIDPMLDPVLEKEIIKKGSRMYVNVSDKMMDYDPNFKMYFITRLEKHLYNGEISWGTFQYMVSDVQYGGKITDSLDVRLFRTYTKEWLTERTCEENFSFNPSSPILKMPFEYTVPAFPEHVDFRKYIEQFPEMDSPESFGLHPNADLTYCVKEATALFKTLGETQPKGGGGDGGVSREDVVHEKLS